MNLNNTSLLNLYNNSYGSNVIESQEIGGLLYFLIYISDYLPYTLLSLLGTVVGIFGNLIIIGAVICNKDLHTTTNVLVFNLSLADIIISGFVDSFSVAGVFIGKSFFDQRMGLCSFIGAICLVACETSLMNIGFLAFNRYINICHHKLYAKMFTFRKTIIYCIITWMIGILIDIPNIVGWGGHYYDLKTLNCVWDRLASKSYSIFFPMSSIVSPCVCILFFYLRIFLYAHNSKNKVLPNSSNTKVNSSHEFNRSLRIAKGLFASFMLFTLCWLPYGLIVMADYQDKLPRSFHMFSMLIAHLNSSMNPLLYAIFNPGFQKGYKKFIQKILFIKQTERSSRSNLSTIKVSDSLFRL